MINFLDLYAQHLEVKDAVESAIADVISNADFIGGDRVAHFERCFADYIGVKYCLGVGNGTDALEIALEALDLPAKCEVLVPALSFIATSEEGTRAGHQVVFCDIDPRTMTLSAQDAARRVTPATAAIIAVHLYGHSAHMGEIGELAAAHGLRLIEDCAQAHGATFEQRRLGSIGDVGCFSFYPGKNLGAYGDAGAIVTNDEDLARRCRMIANHGRVSKYEHVMEGRNSRIDALQAAILTAKLERLEAWNERRRQAARWYNQMLSSTPGIVCPVEMPWARHVYHLYVIRHRKREALRRHLNDMGIQSGVHYPISLPRLPAYRYLELDDEPMVAHEVADTVLSLPMGPHLDHGAVSMVADTVLEFRDDRS